MDFKVLLIIVSIFTHSSAEDLQHSTMISDTRVSKDGKLIDKYNLGCFVVEGLNLCFDIYSDEGVASSGSIPGYTIPMFDAKIYKLDSKIVRASFLDGEYEDFYVKGNELTNSNGFNGEIHGDSVKIFNNQGDVFIYELGRISEAIYTDNHFVWVRNDDDIHITHNKNKIAELTKNMSEYTVSFSGEESKIQVNEFPHVGRPYVEYMSLKNNHIEVVQSLEGRFVNRSILDNVSKITQSVSYDINSNKLDTWGGRKVQISYTENERPKISIATDQGYEVVQNSIKRYSDRSVELLGEGMTKTTIYIYTPKGTKIRKIFIEKDGVKEVLYQAYYDDVGGLMRDTYKDFERRIDEDKISIYKNGELIRKHKK